MNELISIIVPAYNMEKYLERCLDSLVNQTYKNIEILLINDGSTDNTLDICMKYRENYDFIKVFDKINGGLSSARNLGIDNAKGQYITFVDSDDYLDINFVEILFSEIKYYNADIAISDVNDRALNGNIIKHQVDSEMALRMIGTDSWLISISCAKLYNISLFRNLRFELGRIHEDEFIIHHLINNSKLITYTNEVAYNYIIRSDSISGSKTKSKKYIDGCLGFLDRTYFMKDKAMYLQAMLALHNAVGYIIQCIYKPSDKNLKNYYILLKLFLKCTWQFITILFSKGKLKEKIYWIVVFIFPSKYKIDL